MAFLRTEKKKSGTYLRIVQSYKKDGKPKHKTLHSLGKLEDYPPEQLERIAEKLLELSGKSIEEISTSFKEIARLNYGYALVISQLWRLFSIKSFISGVNTQVRFDWENVLKLMIAERINEPVSKRQNFRNKHEYIGFGQSIELQHFYRTLDVIYQNQGRLKQHLFEQRRSLFSQELDVVFYDVTTLYFDSNIQQENALRQKGYSKDGKAHKTQIVLGLLVDKMRNPISYQIYKGNTYEGHTMIDALRTIKRDYKVNNVVVIADSAMIDKVNRAFITQSEFEYILGDRIKSLPQKIKTELLDKNKHLKFSYNSEQFTYTSVQYNDRKIICTYSEKRARKDAAEREKLIDKAKKWIANPSLFKQTKKRGAGRFIQTDDTGTPELNLEKIEAESKYDGFKAIATTTDLSVREVLSKYRDLFEVEHAFRTLKSQLQVRPVFHWTDKRIEGHIAVCFLAYAFLNYIRNVTSMQYKEIIKILDKMQMSKIEEGKSKEPVYMRSALEQNTKILAQKLKLVVPKDLTPQGTVNQIFE